MLDKKFTWFKKLVSLILAFICLQVPIHGFSAETAHREENIDQHLEKVMKAYHVPVVGYAIINNNKIVSSKTLSINPNIAVTTNSLFQAASISKSVSAYAVLKWVDSGKISLDRPVNNYLKSWKIQKNRFNRYHPVTLRQILNMTSGLSVSGFSGYEQGKPLPSLIEILNGTPPANNKPIRVFYTPGTKYFYSGGSYQVLQQLMINVGYQSFNTMMAEEVLAPLKMSHSIYEFPLTKKLRKKAVPGFWVDGKMLTGGWNNYAISASGGLWSTPTDLAKFALNITDSYKGKKDGLISRSLATDMLTRGKNTDFGLGVIVNGKGRSLNFRKNGHNYGYYSQLIMFPNTGQGLIIMTDSENGMEVINYITPIIARKYHWPCYFPFSFELVVIPEFSCYCS